MAKKKGYRYNIDALKLEVVYECPVNNTIYRRQVNFYDISSVLGYYDSIDDYEINIQECRGCCDAHEVSVSSIPIVNTKVDLSHVFIHDVGAERSLLEIPLVCMYCGLKHRDVLNYDLELENICRGEKS